MLRNMLLMATAGLALTACGGKSGAQDQNVTGLGNGAASTAVEDTAAQAVGAATAPLANSVDAFVTNATISDMYEIEAGKIALEKAKSPEVKAFGKMMVKDHTATSSKMKATIAEAKINVTPPKAMDSRRQGMIENLKTASATDFDKVYLDQQSAAHQEALTLMKSYAEDGENAPLKKLAAATAPIVQHHYDQVQKMDKAGADSAK